MYVGRLVLLMSLLFGCPLVGVLLAGKDLTPYLAFPPAVLTPPSPAPFSWPVFVGLACAILIVLAPFVYRWLTFPHGGRSGRSGQTHFPWWGWLGLVALAGAWTLAWSRFPWFRSFQAHTFTPLWLSYIVIVNALTYARTGQCMMLARTREFLMLFPLSAVFWWTFEYLNRFVHNWFYVGTHTFDAMSYFWFATIPFSTVLPAVLGTYELLGTFPNLSAPFESWKSVPIPRGRSWGWMLCLTASGTLVGIGMVPEVLYPFVWLSPLMLIAGLQRLLGCPSSLDRLEVGDWRPVTLSALAALICGFFWEMWNWHSLAHWEYAIPYVHGFQIFEMPLLGYAGYLPFGLICLLFTELVMASSPLTVPSSRSPTFMPFGQAMD